MGDSTTTNSSLSVQVSGLMRVSAIAVGDSYRIVLRSDGTVWSWGADNFGQLGNGTMTQSSVPVQVSGLASVSAIAAASSSSMGLRSDGTNILSNVPIQFSRQTSVTSIAVGASNGLAIAPVAPPPPQPRIWLPIVTNAAAGGW